MSEKENIIEQLANQIDQLTTGRLDWTELVAVAIDRVRKQRWRARVADAEAQEAAYKAEHGVMHWSEYCEKYGMHRKEQHAARAILKLHLNGRHEYFVDQPPTDQQRRQIADETTFSANQACSYLGISRYKFDKLRKQHNIEPAGMFRTRNMTTESGFPVGANLYRKSDLDRLAQIIEGES